MVRSILNARVKRELLSTSNASRESVTRVRSNCSSPREHEVVVVVPKGQSTRDETGAEVIVRLPEAAADYSVVVTKAPVSRRTSEALQGDVGYDADYR